ncbi:TPA: DnaD domain protein [Streptococcus equi subsp. zooepidemicus]|nr:putative DNA replication protein [Streptococcus satellite phage Javan193]QBX07832.1 putative DNA replication protein [Streptococcus satellite phage Javan194]HEK9955268.1 DnaD domain protein [Streptococcus equi subsp. zooepidemicus]HEK9993965.1 DnaD domain protein [Streptococcus equi subsp. zooepidemicus]HEL0045977.1 DnaD domain protein [Streptococcus equi subsp. zooepidemicus]
MGNRRMISKTVTQTQRFLRLPLEAQALYFHLIQNSDDDGVVEAFPVVRMIGASDDSLGLLVIKQFIKPLNDEMVYFIVDFHEQNTVRKDRYVPSIHKKLLETAKNQGFSNSKSNGLPSGNQMATNGFPNISKDNISKYNIRGSSINNIIGQNEQNQQKETITPPPFNQDFVNLYQAFEAETGRALSPLQIEDLNYMLEDFSPDLIHEALKEAVSQGKANFAYIKAILNRWKQDNLLTVELVRNNKAAREQQKQKSTTGNQDWQESLKEPNPEYGF